MPELVVFAIDTSIGLPAEGLAFRLDRLAAGGEWKHVLDADIGADGLARTIVDAVRLTDGEYRLIYDVGAYFRLRGPRALFQRICVDFSVHGDQSIVVPLLLSPYSYTVYRGSD